MTVNVWKLIPTPGGTDLAPVPLPEWVHNLNDASTRLPSGAYTTLRTYQGRKVLQLAGHVERLVETARLAGRPIALDEKTLRAAMRQLAHVLPPGADLRFRLTVDLEVHPGEVYIATEPLTIPPPEAYRQGVCVITCDLQRQLPEAKLTRFIARSSSVRQALPADINEAIMVSPEGCLLEGLSSNFFAIVGGVVRSAEKGVLYGITRSLALEGARALGLAVELSPVRMAELAEIEEAFITSSSRGVLPVRQIDTQLIGMGTPGEITQQIMAAFSSRVQSMLEYI